MKYVIFSDVHGNSCAFEAMRRSLLQEEITGYLFCGDLTGYYYQAKKIMQEFKRLPNLHAVLGNHDLLYLDACADIKVQQKAIRDFGNSYRDLDVEIARYIRSLPDTVTLKIGDFHIAMLHGSPDFPLSGRIYPDSLLPVAPLEFDFLFVGHTHYQMTRLHEKNCTIVNPGSLGQPRDGKGFAYCVVDFATGRIERRKVEFALSPLLAEIAGNDPDAVYLADVLKRNA